MRQHTGELVHDPDKEGRSILIIRVERDFGRYYIRLCEMETFRRAGESRLGPHASIILDENGYGLERFDGAHIKFWYSHNHVSVNKYLLMNIECPEAHKIREKCGLSYRLSKYRLHLTLGNFKEKIC